MRTITGLDELKQAEGEELGVSEWHEVSQEDIDAFADATGDHQWIHVDPERAKDTPFGCHDRPRLLHAVAGADAHRRGPQDGGLRLRRQLRAQQGALPGAGARDSKVRMRAKLAELEEIPGGAQMIMELTFEREGGEKPVCVAQSVVRGG